MNPDEITKNDGETVVEEKRLPAKTKFSRDDILPATRVKLRIMYESGEYSTFKAFYQAAKEILEPCPCESTLRDYVFDNGWDRDRIAEVIEQKKQMNVTEILSDLGMDMVERIRYLIKGVKASDSVLEMIEETKNHWKKTKQSVTTHPHNLLILKSLQETNFKGLKIMLEAIKELHSMTGDNAPVKVKQIGGNGGNGCGSGGMPVESLSDEELEEEYQRMKRAGIIDLIESEGNKQIEAKVEVVEAPKNE